jgi:hypothetical protein
VLSLIRICFADFDVGCVLLVEVILPRLTEDIPMNIPHPTPTTPLRERMISDMSGRNLGPASQTSHLRALLHGSQTSRNAPSPRRISCGTLEAGAAKCSHPVENTDANLGFCFLVCEIARL